MLEKTSTVFFETQQGLLFQNSPFEHGRVTRYETSEVNSNDYKRFDDGCCLRSTAVNFDAKSVQWHHEVLLDWNTKQSVATTNALIWKLSKREGGGIDLPIEWIGYTYCY